MRIEVLLLAIPVMAGCRRGDSGETLVEWRGNQRGRFTVATTASHCAESGVVEILAARADTGFGLALFLRDSAVIAAGDYQVFLGSTLAEPRPGAAVGLRWFTGVDLAAFESVSGTVTVSRADGELSASLAVRMQGVSSSDTLALTAQVRKAPVTQAGPGCGRTSRRNIR